MSESDPIDLTDPEFLASCYLDSELDDAERRAFERRLKASPDLDTCLKSYATIDRHLQSLADPPQLDWERFGMQVGARWRGEQRKRRHGRWLRRLAGLAAAAAFALVVTRMALDEQHDPSKPAGNAVVTVEVGPRTVGGGRIRFSHGGPLFAAPHEQPKVDETPGPMIIAYVAGS